MPANGRWDLTRRLKGYTPAGISPRAMAEGGVHGSRGSQNGQNSKICSGFFRTGLRFSDRRRLSGSNFTHNYRTYSKPVFGKRDRDRLSMLLPPQFPSDSLPANLLSTWL